MKRRIISVCCAVVMIMGLTITAGFQTNATESQPINNHSYLTHETESTGILRLYGWDLGSSTLEELPLHSMK